MKIKYLSVYSRIISFLLILLGFSSCDNGGVEYGTPNAKFIVKGKVVDEKDNNIEGLKVALGRVESWSDVKKVTYYTDSINTDAEGSFKLSIDDFPKDQKFVIRYDNSDRQESSVSIRKIDTVRFENPNFTNGSGNWYAGETTKNLGTVKVNMSIEE